MKPNRSATQKGGIADPRVAVALRERLHGSIRAAVAPIPIAVPLLFIVLSRTTDSTWLGIWCALAMLSGLVQWLAYLRLPAGQDWTQRAIITQFFAGVVWGIFPILVMPDTQVWQAMVGTTLLSVLASSALFAAPIRGAYLAFLVPAGLIGTAAFALLAEGDARFMALLIPPATGFYLYLAEFTHQAAVESAELTLALEKQADTDALTELANRGAFLKALDLALSSATRHDGDLVVAFLDLDDFKKINDFNGHEAGDRALVAVSRRLESVLESNELVARIGGDEFTVLAVADTHIDTDALGARLVAAFDEPLLVGSVEIAVTCSIGMARATRGQSPTELLGEADRAQYRVKRAGGHGADLSS